jgi:hypothetical protein
MIIPRRLDIILPHHAHRHRSPALPLLLPRESLHLRLLRYAVGARTVKLRVLAVGVAHPGDGAGTLRSVRAAADGAATAGVPVCVGAIVCVGGALAGGAHDTGEEVFEEFAEGGHGAANDEEVCLDKAMNGNQSV